MSRRFGPYDTKALKLRLRRICRRLWYFVCHRVSFGVIADWLSIPTLVDHIKASPGKNFPDKVRNFLISMSSTTRFPNANMNVLYNGYRDHPCMYPQSDSEPKSPGVARRAGGDNPVMINGTIVDRNFYSGVSGRAAHLSSVMEQMLKYSSSHNVLQPHPALEAQQQLSRRQLPPQALRPPRRARRSLLPLPAPLHLSPPPRQLIRRRQR